MDFLQHAKDFQNIKCNYEQTYGIKKTPYRCPICNGKGLVPCNFYSFSTFNVTSAATPETCRSCGGNGILWG